MTATERLRQLLDERGVGHIDYGGRGHDDETGRPATWWSSEQGECAAIQHDDDLLTVEAHLTPEQAVEATLGRGTCKNVSDFPKYEFVCSACGGKLDILDEFDNPTMLHDDNSIGPRFCPSCGRKVE